MTDISTTTRFAVLLTLANGFIDPYTILMRGGVFANVQTGNVIFFAVNVSAREWGQALDRVWPLLAFVSGVAVAAHLKAGGLDRILPYPLRWTMAIQAMVLAVSGLVPVSTPHSYVTVPISLLAGMQTGLFRYIGDVGYFPVATTGNLVRFVLVYDWLIARHADARRGFLTYCWLIPAFSFGAVLGAFVTRAVGVHAIWIPAALLGLTLTLLVLDRREGATAAGQLAAVSLADRRSTV